MSEITQLKAQRFKERENKRHYFDIKKLKTENKREFSSEESKHKTVMSHMNKNYESRIGKLENKLERRLIELRGKQKVQLRDENERLDGEVDNLKIVHADQVEEIKKSQTNEIESMIKSHTNTLENARQKYMQEKIKWDV